MDGFHLAQTELVRLRREHRKGAIDTFDVAGYVALLRRLRDPAEDVVYAPVFRRDLEEPIGSAVPVGPDVPLVITEGNYLLVADGPWGAVRALLDEAWYVATPHDARRHRLIERPTRRGRGRSARTSATRSSSSARGAAAITSSGCRSDRLTGSAAIG
jgi:pantothenate kinase